MSARCGGHCQCKKKRDRACCYCDYRPCISDVVMREDIVVKTAKKPLEPVFIEHTPPSIQKGINAEIERMLFGNPFTVARPDGTTVPLTAEILQDSMSRLKRETGHFFVVGVDNLPDDCYGIIYLRKADAEKINGKKGKKA